MYFILSYFFDKILIVFLLINVWIFLIFDVFFSLNFVIEIISCGKMGLFYIVFEDSCVELGGIIDL